MASEAIVICLLLSCRDSSASQFDDHDCEMYGQ